MQAIELNIQNKSAAIGDGQVYIINPGNYSSIHWSDLQTPEGVGSTHLKEGIWYTVEAINADGMREITRFQIEPTSTQEKMNAWFTPIVEAFGEILFFDPFATFQLYDPTVKDAEGKIVRHPNGEPVKSEIWLVVLLLIGTAVYFTFYFRFIQIRAFRHAWKITFGQFTKKSEPGEVTPFQALSAALSGTLGLGNISLVAVAIAVGGPGATFWIIVAGLVGMTTKFVECTLGVKYRKIDETGEVSGGPMYYLSKGLAHRGWQRTGKFLAIV
ncbi:MAG: alanine:cation symporter family protein, partial [Bacteroidota bacterium]